MLNGVKVQRCLTVDNVVATYTLVPEPIEDVRRALSEILDYLNNLHCAFLGELTKWS